LCSASRLRLGRPNKTSLVLWCRRHIGLLHRSRWLAAIPQEALAEWLDTTAFATSAAPVCVTP
jgi:hypothetical protein